MSHEKTLLWSASDTSGHRSGLVGNATFNGAYDRNPFNFDHFNPMGDFGVLGRTAAVWHKMIKPLTTDFANELYVRA